MGDFDRIARAAWLAAALAALAGPVPVHALPFSQLVVFGDSLSDSGNNAIVFDGLFAPQQPRTRTPIPDNSFVPALPLAFPYVSGRYTDDRVWAEYLGASLGLGVAPSLAGGTNFAFGGANTGPLGATIPPSLLTQMAGFLSASGGVAPDSALYVIAGGGNNARDALVAIGGGADVAATIQSTAGTYAADVSAMIAALLAAGADDIIVWNTPDIGLTPAVLGGGAAASILATTIASAMNAALTGAVGGVAGVEIFDVFGIVQDIAGAPGAFGLANATDACARFVDCDPSTYFFWDGIHPTSAVHRIIAREMLNAVPSPGSLLLLLVGLGLLVVARRALAAGATPTTPARPLLRHLA